MREGERKIDDGNHLYTFTTLRVILHVAEAISYFDWEEFRGKSLANAPALDGLHDSVMRQLKLR